MGKAFRKQLDSIKTYNTREAANKLGISVKTIQRRCHACGIEKTGRDFRLSDRDLKKIQNAERPVGNPQMRKGNKLWKRARHRKRL